MKKTSAALPAVFLFFLLINHCASTQPTYKPAPPEPLPAPAAVTFLHWNDFHSANIPYPSSWGYTKGQMIGGYATIGGYIDSLENIYPNPVILNVGDDFQGSPISALTKGLSQITILNEIHPTAFTIGNHEFDYGKENLQRAVNAAGFEVVSCNLFDSTKTSLFVKPYTIIKSGDIRIGIIGVIMEDLKSTVLPNNMAHMATLDPAQSIMKYVNEIQDKTDAIVVISHSGFREDSLLATQLMDVDAIFGGHSHTRLKKPVLVNNILICQAGSRGQFLGRLTATIDPRSKSFTDYNYELIETLVKKIKPSPSVAKIVDSLEADITTEMDRVIGQLVTPWVRNGNGESNIGDWTCDVTRAYFNADIAFQNSGGIRKGLNAGPIKVRDIWEISPFDNTVVLVTVTGEQLNKIIEWRIQNPRDFLQQSGLRRVYNLNQKTVVEASVNGKSIDPLKHYIIATNNYIVGHIDRFFGLTESEVTINDTGVIGRDILLQAAEEQGTIDSKTDGRFMIDNRTK